MSEEQFLPRNVAVGDVKISSDNKTIYANNDDNIMYGNLWMQPRKTNIVQYNFKINKVEGKGIVIGITATTDHDWDKKNPDFPLYLYGSDGNKLDNESSGDGSKYGDKWVDGDTLTMNIDFTSMKLSYSLNKVDQGIAYQPIHDTKYKLIVMLFEKNSSVSLINAYFGAVTAVASNDDVKCNECDAMRMKSNQQNEEIKTLQKALSDERKQIKKLNQLMDVQQQSQKMTENALNNAKKEIVTLKMEMLEEQKTMDIMIKSYKSQIRELKMKSMDTSDWRAWSSEDIFLWILSLDGGKYEKYKTILKEKLDEDEVEGEDLLEINGSDVKEWGIKKLSHRKDLLRHIQQLTQNKNENIYKANEGGTAYM